MTACPQEGTGKSPKSSAALPEGCVFCAAAGIDNRATNRSSEMALILRDDAWHMPAARQALYPSQTAHDFRAQWYRPCHFFRYRPLTWPGLKHKTRPPSTNRSDKGEIREGE